jgi:uncharacterized membrane protein YesL
LGLAVKNMDLMNSKLYSALEFMANLFLLNLLWILMCLPIVTAGPATAAMYGVVRKWILYQDSSLFRDYFKYFKENFKKSFILGLCGLLIGTLLLVNLSYYHKLDSYPSIFGVILVLVALLLLSMSVYLFPVIVHFKDNGSGLVKNAFLISIHYFPTTILLLALHLVTAIIVIMVPISGIILFSVTSYLSFLMCLKVFKKIQQ